MTVTPQSDLIKWTRIFLLLILATGTCGLGDSVFGAGLPVIPGAKGYGITTPAGRDGAIYRVTNLYAGGSGSLRAALDAKGPRVVVFEVSGTIVLTENLEIKNPYITVAGQTAPSPGITLRGAGLVITTHDVLVQHLRIRVGDNASGHNPDNRDGISIEAGREEVYNVVIDHCSVSWAVDGNIDLWYPGVHDVTIRNCIISEALNDSIHPKGPHSTALLVGDGIRNISVIGNLFAHNADRNPLLKQDSRADMINNLIYNWDWYAARTFASANFIGNFFLPGPQSRGHVGITVQNGGESPSLKANSVYVKDNIDPHRSTNTGDDWLAVNGDSLYRSYQTIGSLADVVAQEVTAVYEKVLNTAGARSMDRDDVDIRVVNSVRGREGRIINSQAEVGAWPILAENTRKLTLPNNPSSDDDGDGYTNLEEWLHSYSAELEFQPADDINPPAPPQNLHVVE